jgi:VanZ family protein
MAVIFFMSSQQGDQSEKLSKKIVNQVYQHTTLNVSVKVAYNTNFFDYNRIFRKTAHFAESLVLSFLLHIAFTCSGLYLMNSLRISFVFSSFYACLDEFHQYFIPGRDPSFADVSVDVFGVLAGLTLVLFSNKIFHREKYTRR